MRTDNLLRENFDRREKRKLIKEGNAEAKDIVDLEKVAPKRIQEGVLAFMKQLEDDEVITKRVFTKPTFTVGSTHTFSTNIKSNVYSQSKVQEAIIMTIEEMIEMVTGEALPSGHVIRLRSLDREKKQIKYEIVVDSDSKSSSLFVPIDNDDDDEIVIVEPFTYQNNRELRGHPSVMPHVKRTGVGMANYLIKNDCVNTDLANAPRIKEGMTDPSSWGIYVELIVNTLLDELIIKKSGFTKTYLKRKEGYDPATILAEYCDLSKLQFDIDIALQYFLKDFVDGVKKDPKVPPAIKNLICEVFYERGGGRFGGFATLGGKLVEVGFQYINNECVIAEMVQFSDDDYYGMIAKVIEAREAVRPIIAPTNAQAIADADIDILSSWKPAPHPDPRRGDQLYLTPIASFYAAAGLLSFDFTNRGPDELPNAYDDAANPGATTQEERWSKDFNDEQDKAAKAKIQCLSGVILDPNC